MILVDKPCTRFEPISSDECGNSGLASLHLLKECRSNMFNGEFCQADKTLPDGNTNHEISNCGRYFDVFKCIIGTNTISDMIIHFVVLKLLSSMLV